MTILRKPCLAQPSRPDSTSQPIPLRPDDVPLTHSPAVFPLSHCAAVPDVDAERPSPPAVRTDEAAEGVRELPL